MDCRLYTNARLLLILAVVAVVAGKTGMPEQENNGTTTKNYKKYVLLYKPCGACPRVRLQREKKTGYESSSEGTNPK